MTTAEGCQVGLEWEFAEFRQFCQEICKIRKNIKIVYLGCFDYAVVVGTCFGTLVGVRKTWNIIYSVKGAQANAVIYSIT